uniref:ATP-binding protein n=2 Tax=Roseivirga sp. TaxID=1964215 RepID=UPI0040482971
MKKSFYVLLIAIITNISLAQDSLRIAQELQRSGLIRYSNPDSSLVYAENVVRWSDNIGSKWQKAQGLRMIGNHYQVKLKSDSSMEFFSKALKAFEELGDSVEIGATYISLAQVNLEKGLYDQAMVNNVKAMEIFESIANNKFLNRVYNTMAQIYSAIGDYESTVKYFHKSFKLSAIKKDTINLGLELSNLAAVHEYLKNYDSVAHYYHKAVDFLTLKNNIGVLGNANLIMGNAQGAQGHFTEAEKYYQMSLANFEEAGIAMRLADTYFNYGVLKDTLGLTKEAIDFYEKALTISKKEGGTEIPNLASRKLKLLYAKSGDYKRAFQMSLLNDTLESNFMNLEKQELITNLETQFRTKEKEQQIALQQSTLSTQEARLERNQALIIGLISITLLLIILVLLNRNRANKKEQLIKQDAQLKLREAELNAVINSQEKERNRFARDLHDGFGQLISVLKLNLSMLNDKDAQYPEKRMEVYKNGESVINDMYAELRSICFDLMPQTLIKKGLTLALKEFGERINQSKKVSCEVIVFTNQERLSEIIEISLFRISQEWVNNILKYANAEHITIQLTRDEGEITLTIEDDGHGFDPKLFFEGKGNGWRNIQTRLNLIRGHFDLDSQSERRGTMITVNVPYGIDQDIPTSTERHITA